MEAIQALQLQTDAKHRRITGQVSNELKYTNAKNYFSGCFSFEIQHSRQKSLEHLKKKVDATYFHINSSA